MKHRKPYPKWWCNGLLTVNESTGREDYPVTIIGETDASYRVIVPMEIGLPYCCRPGDIILVEKSSVRIEPALMTADPISPLKPTKGDPASPISYLYRPPANALAEAEDSVNLWHRRMAAEFVATELAVFETLFHWLEKRRVSPAAMLSYGVFPSVSRYQSGILAPEFHKKVVGHGRVVRRKERRRGGYVVLGEPFGIVGKVEQDPYIAAWRSLGSRVTCSPESGWSPGKTVMVLIEAPFRK